MISFVWSASATWSEPVPVLPGHGGAETVTLGHCRELTRRGLANRIVTFGMGAADGRELSPDVRFEDYPAPADLDPAPGPTLLVTDSLDVPSAGPPYVVLHNPPYAGLGRQHYRARLAGRRLLAPSRAAAARWAAALQVPAGAIGVVHPFAGPQFAAEPVPPREPGPVRVLFAGRLSAGKGFYTFLEALHLLPADRFDLTVVLSGTQGDEYPLIAPLVRAHPMLRAVPQLPPGEVARLLVTQDVLVMPSHGQLWPEPFGVLSVEAQHAGCRVVASDVGGLPETDCGGLDLVTPDDPVALARGIRRAGRLGRLPAAERAAAAARFGVRQSVDALLDVLRGDLPVYAGGPARHERST